MNTKTMFQNFRARIVRIGILKSLLLALIAGFAVNGITALATWFIVDLTLPVVLGISIGLGVLTFALCVPILYYAFFRPTTYRIAQMLDRLGLEERMITMYELENDSSYIAMLQREDAQKQLRSVTTKQLKLQMSVLAIVLLAFSFVFALSFTTVSALAAAGVVIHGKDIGKAGGSDIGKIGDYYVVNYFVFSEGGRIEGEEQQIIGKGQNTTQVTAVANDGYVFYMWTDETGEEALGVSATRIEFNVQEDMNFYAVFVEKKPGEGKPNDGEDKGGEDDKQGEKEDPNEGDEQKPDDGEDPEDGDNKKDEEKPKDDNTDDDPKEGDEPGAGEGHARENNKVIDGNQDYHDVFDFEKGAEDLAQNNTYPDELKGIVGDFQDGLKA